MEELLTIGEKLGYVQSRLHAPKGQFNKFGGYRYRSCEDIVEAVKPLLAEVGAQLTLSDELVCIGERHYVRATATFMDGLKATVETCGYAREVLEKKGMDGSQITGMASSYARKYALNGLFLIDDTKDADAQEPNQKEPKTEEPQKVAPNVRLNEAIKAFCIANNLDFKETRNHIMARDDFKVGDDRCYELIAEELEEACR